MKLNIDFDKVKKRHLIRIAKIMDREISGMIINFDRSSGPDDEDEVSIMGNTPIY